MATPNNDHDENAKAVHVPSLPKLDMPLLRCMLDGRSLSPLASSSLTPTFTTTTPPYLTTREMRVDELPRYAITDKIVIAITGDFSLSANDIATIKCRLKAEKAHVNVWTRNTMKLAYVNMANEKGMLLEDNPIRCFQDCLTVYKSMGDDNDIQKQFSEIMYQMWDIATVGDWVSLWEDGYMHMMNMAYINPPSPGCRGCIGKLIQQVHADLNKQLHFQVKTKQANHTNLIKKRKQTTDNINNEVQYLYSVPRHAHAPRRPVSSNVFVAKYVPPVTVKTEHSVVDATDCDKKIQHLEAALAASNQKLENYKLLTEVCALIVVFIVQ